MNAFISFFCALLIGPICDVSNPQILVCVGVALNVLFYGVLGVCHEYWHFMIDIGLVSGLASSLLYVPSVVTVGQYFHRRRGLATGIAYSGGSAGGIFMPLMLRSLLPKIGWAWTTRAVGLLTLGLGVAAILLIRPRLAPVKKPTTFRSILPDFRVYHDIAFCATSFGIFFLNIAFFIPVGYLPSYALAQGLSETTAYHSLTFLNVGSCIGRWVPAYASDKIGRFNMMLMTVSLCLISTLAIWLPAGSSLAGLICFALIFGFASGSNLSLSPVCVSQLCKLSEYARFYTTCTFLASFGYVGHPFLFGATSPVSFSRSRLTII